MSDTDALVEFLADRHVSCPNCGYDLHGLRNARCPECDLQLALRVNLVDPRLGAWIVAVVGLSCGVGFEVLLLAYFGWMKLVSGFAPSAVAMVPLVVGFMVQGSALLALLRGRGWFRRRAGWARAAVASACWVITLASALVFFGLVG